MNRLRQPGHSDYDVLGLSSGATDEEIDYAFRWLIDGEGYRIGVPRNRQWLRARQIKEAYATLRPAKRGTDRKKKSRADQGLGVELVRDTAEEELVAPTVKPRRAKQHKNSADPKVGIPANAVPTDPAPVMALGSAPAPSANELLGLIAKGPPSPDVPPPPDDNERGPAPARNDSKRVRVGIWGAATAIVLGMGLVLISSWPDRDDQSSTVERAPELTPDLRQASAAPRQSAPAGNERTAHGAGELVPGNMADAQSPAAVKPASIDPSPVKTSSPAKAVETRATAVSEKAPASQATATKNVRVRSSRRLAGTAPQWLGGGPTNADNWQGRYQGRVALQVNVERSGRVSKCAAVRGSGNAELDALTCRLVRERARFTPARDSNGRPVAGQAYTTFVWMPGRGN